MWKQPKFAKINPIKIYSEIINTYKVIPDFNIQNLVKFEDNLKYNGDMPLAAYTDLETTATAGFCLNPEDKKMFAVSYNIILTYYSELNFECVIIECGYDYSLEKLWKTSLDYLAGDQMPFVNLTTLLQPREAAHNLSVRTDKLNISIMVKVKIKKFRIRSYGKV